MAGARIIKHATCVMVALRLFRTMIPQVEVATGKHAAGLDACVPHQPGYKPDIKQETRGHM